MRPLRQLFSQIIALKGDRQVTVISSYLGVRLYDISEKGIIGYAAMRWTHSTDCETGKPLEPEQAVQFFNWSGGVEVGIKKK
jgi:hypothetical protein